MANNGGSARVVFGWLLLFGGVIGLIVSLNMKTTVETGGYTEFGVYVPRSEVHNLGLMNQKQNFVIASGLVTLIGVILLAVGGGGKQRGVTSNQGGSAALRPCPFCAEMIQKQAALCRFCNREVEPEVPSTAQEAASVDEPTVACSECGRPVPESEAATFLGRVWCQEDFEKAIL